MTAGDRRDLARRLGVARRRLAEADRLVQVGHAGSRRRWRSMLAGGPAAARLEREAVAALDSGDDRSAREAVERLERAAARAHRDSGGRG